MGIGDQELFQALMQSQMGGGANPLAPGGGGGGGGLSDIAPAPDAASEDLRQKFIEMISGEVEPEKLGIGRTLALALANAGSAYAAGINPNVKQSDFISQALALSERRATRETRRRQVAGRTGLENLNREDAIKTRAAERREDRALTESENRLNRKARAAEVEARQAEAERDRAMRQEMQKSIIDLRSDLSSAGIKSNERIARMNAEVRRDIAAATAEQREQTISESDKKAERELRGQIRQSVRGSAVSGIAPLAERLASGEVSIEQIREDMQDLVGDGTFAPATRERLFKFYLANVEPVLQNFEGAQAGEAMEALAAAESSRTSAENVSGPLGTNLTGDIFDGETVPATSLFNLRAILGIETPEEARERNARRE